MIRKPITCPTCGDTWKRVLAESFTRLGPALHECRACWTPFATGEREWRDMDSTARIGYFLQNLLLIAPLFALLIVAVLATWFFGGIEPADAKDYLLFGTAILFSIYLVLNLWSALMIALSQRRSAKAAAPRVKAD